jgi:hypothetical protein
MKRRINILSIPSQNSKTKTMKHIIGFLAASIMVFSIAIPSAFAQKLNRNSLPIPQGPFKGQWELYKIDDDFSEANNLATAQPEKLRQLKEMFWVEAAMHNALPIENSRIDRFDVSNSAFRWTKPSIAVKTSVHR